MTVHDETAQSSGLIGASLPRLQDDRMLRGRGRYVDDLDESGVLHAAILRSPVASGDIVHFDAGAALAADGVALVLGPDEVAAVTDPIACSWPIMGQRLVHMPLAERSLRYVGQPFGLVVAESRAAAEDAAELVDFDVKERPAVVTVDGARAAGAPLVYPELDSNQVGTFHFGAPVEDLETVFATAAHVVERELSVPRISHSPLEPRGLVAEWVPAVEQLTVVASTQVPHLMRQDLARALRLRVDQVRVVAPDVGGSFGQKASLFADEGLVGLAAKTLGGKVKWIEDRSESLTASYQGRGTLSRSRLALDADGRFLALHTDLHGDVGAFTGSGTGGSGPFQVAGLMVEGPYRFDKAGATVTAWYTNAVPTAAFRGYGMQEGTWVRERLVDEAARELGRDPVELRRHNMLTPDQLPYVTHTQVPYDNGDYPKVLDKAAAIGAAKARPSAGRIRRGIGLASMVEITGFAPSALLEMYHIHWSGWESSTIRINEDGTVTVFSGVTSVGQGIETSLAQIAAERLGVTLDWVTVQLGDTATATYSNIAAQASRALTLAGGALLEQATFSPDGQPTATTYLDYIVPLSEDVPDIDIEHVVTPSQITPGGFKGLGESGTIPPPAAIGNAVATAVPEIAEHLVSMPLSPPASGPCWTARDSPASTNIGPAQTGPRKGHLVQITTSFDVPVPPDRAWDVLLDVERIAPCMPGATLDSHDGDLYEGRVKLKFGPVLAQYAGTMQIIERDPDSHSLCMVAKGREQRGTGRAEATVRARLTKAAEGSTQVDVDTEFKLSGRAAQFGRSVLQDVSKRLVTTFADNLADQLRPPLRTAGDSTGATDHQPLPVVPPAPSNLNVLSLLAANTRLRVVAIAMAVLVVAVDISEERVNQLRDEFGAAVVPVAADVRDWEENVRSVQTALEHFSRLDVYVGNAGIHDGARALTDIDGARLPDAFHELFGVNVLALLLGVRAASDALIASRGCVILTGSFASFHPSGGGVLYTASKHAVLGIVRQLTYELAPDVRVNGVAPGIAPTRLGGISALGQQAQDSVLEGTRDVLPSQQVPTTDDYGGIFTMLATPRDSGLITGTMVVADSGLSIRGLARPGGRVRP